MIEMRTTQAIRFKLNWRVNSDIICAMDNSSSRFLHQIISPKQPTFLSPLDGIRLQFKSGRGETFNAKPMRGRPGRPIQLPNSTLG